MPPIVYPEHEFAADRCEHWGTPIFRCVDCGIVYGTYLRTGAPCVCLNHYPPAIEAAEPGDVLCRFVSGQQTPKV